MIRKGDRLSLIRIIDHIAPYQLDAKYMCIWRRISSRDNEHQRRTIPRYQASRCPRTPLSVISRHLGRVRGLR